MDADLVFLSRDHPAADGRTPVVGEVEYVLHIPVENGRTVELRLGQVCYEHFCRFIREMAVDDALESILP
jgi:hypothetical protein